MPRCTEIDHVGIAVASIAEERAFYESVLGLEYRGIEELAELGVKVAFFGPAVGSSSTCIELLEALSADSPIARHIERRGPGLHHVAYAVDDLDRELAALRQRGIRLVDETPRRGAHGRRIAFLHPSSTNGVLTELCEAACGSH